MQTDSGTGFIKVTEMPYLTQDEFSNIITRWMMPIPEIHVQNVLIAPRFILKLMQNGNQTKIYPYYCPQTLLGDVSSMWNKADMII